MSKITDDDVVNMVEAFAGAALDPGRWLPALSTMSEKIGAVCCALEFTDLNTGAAVMENSVDLDDQLLNQYEERIFHINPRVRRALPLQVGTIVDDSYLMQDGDPNNAEFLDWLERTPYYYMNGAKILNSDGQIGFFTANYSKKQGLPDDSWDPVFRLVVPHIINFVEAGLSLSDNRLRNTLLTHDALDQSRPFALLDRAGRVVECSTGFEAVIRSRHIIGFRNRALIAVHALHRQRVELFLHAALGPRRWLEPPLPIRLATPDCPRGIVLRAVPIAPGNNIFDVFKPAALITLTDLDQPFRVRRDELAALFGLTSREADVAALLSEGHTIESAAHNLSIGEYTVRQHLKAVFGKMGISRQTELVAIVSRLG